MLANEFLGSGLPDYARCKETQRVWGLNSQTPRWRQL